MEFEVKYDAELDCVITRVSGDMTKEPVTAFFTKMAETCEKHDCMRVISDVSQAKVATALADLYFMAQTLEELNISRKLKRAIIVAQDHENFAFWETVCYNQGHIRIKIFPGDSEAKKWLFDEL